MAQVEPWAGMRVGHTRLSVIDPGPQSDQPYWTRDGRGLLAFNGEIYNYRQLAAKNSIELRRDSDTELLAELIHARGIDSVSELNGMFAFVYLNAESQTFHIVRDRLGIKPLYVYRDIHGSVVSSELSAILELIGQQPWDEMAVKQYATMRLFSGGRTIYRGIEMFPPATIESNGRRAHYWNLEPRLDQVPPVEEIEELLRSAVDFRMLSDVPVGTFLSGGIDSALITAISTAEKTYTVGTAVDNEFTEAREIADGLGRSHVTLAVDRAEFLSRLTSMVGDRREPLCVPNEVLIDALAERAKLDVKVLLCGEGADELFAGYHRIFDWAASASTFRIEDFAALYCYGSEYDLEIVEESVSPYLHYQDPYLVLSSFFQQSHLHGLLRRLDFATMHHGVEARVPFVDHRLVEALFGVPYSWKRSNRFAKAPLRTIGLRYLPPVVCFREKKGFPVPLGSMMKLRVEHGQESGYDAWFEQNLELLGVWR